MKITRSQLRRLIRESLEDEQLMYIEKVQKLFPSDANQAIELANTAGIGDTEEVQAMKGLRDLIIKFLERWVTADQHRVLPAKARRKHANITEIKLYDYLKVLKYTEAYSDYTPLIDPWVTMTMGYPRGLPYGKETIAAANELAKWAGVPDPDLKGSS